MFTAIIRVLFGFVLACFAAGLTKVLFAVGPQEVIGGNPDKINTVLIWSAMAATHSAVFAAPFAFLAAAISEWQGIRSFIFHTLVGFSIAMAGFAVQYFGEAPGGNSILNTYAAAAYAVTGLVAGLVYWIFAGRRAAPHDDIYQPVATLISTTTTQPLPAGSEALSRNTPAAQPSPKS